MMTYFWYYLIGFFVMFFGLALANTKNQDTSPNHAVIASLIWPIALVIGIIRIIFSILTTIFEKLSRP